MSESIGTGLLRTGDSPVDRRGWLELVGAFSLFSVLFTLLSIDLVQALLEEQEFTARTLVPGGALGAGIGLGLTVLLLLTWRREGGRVGQRLGRRAWQEMRLPIAEHERRLAVADLQRRERALIALPAPLVLTGFWAFIGALQIAGSTSWLHTVTWLLLVVVPGAITVRTVVDWRRLPQLRMLLEQVESHETR